MDISREPEYYYCRLYLYPPFAAASAAQKPFGAAEIEICGRKGRLICRTESCLGEIARENCHGIFPVMLSRAGESFYIGHIAIEPSGQGVYRWDFSIAGHEDRDSEDKPVTYRILVLAGPLPENNDNGNRKVLMEGVFSLASEVRDNRIVGFMKEAKVRKKSRESITVNPLFQKVEPFEPPIPNCSWWQISIQPNFRSSYWQVGYCPRQKTYKANF